ncbi:MAG: hypothetical protein ABW215_16625 [Kibdelosporangium sp.]
MRRTIRRGLTLSAAATCALVGLGFSQASAAPIPPVSGDLTDVATLAGLGQTVLATSQLPVGDLADALGAPELPVSQLSPQQRSDMPSVVPGMNDVDVAGLPGGAPTLPDVNLTPGVLGGNVNGAGLGALPLQGGLPSTDTSTAGSALSALDVARVLPALPGPGGLPGIG